ncbi:hypothetical protein CXB51_018059 [Gossypium anomalum]|uniref:Integrase catalytic domain-containing protein n=1 Tax=Gossypium anomalum TaxID=47600 RepID=A0A8J5ZH99_9ROSI|nr:hypothetical protein CXB51_018059 [Gossypium anomalum]
MTETVKASNTGEGSEISVNNSNPMSEFQNIQVAYRLNGKNYLKWSQLVRTFLKGRGKLSHLLRTGPKEGDPKFDAWDEQDSMVMSWLWNSMMPEISDTCMFLSTSKEIWEAVKQTYSKVRYAAQIYEIKTKISCTKQGSRSITEYSNLLQSLWQEMDHYQCIQMTCIRVQILGKEELPSLNETIAIVRAEEGRRGVMVENNQVDSSALVTNAVNERRFGLEQPTSEDNRQIERTKSFNKDSVWCTYCKKARHTKDRCWKLHGKPQTTNKNFSEKGISSPQSSKVSNTDTKSSWVIDSGATDHMTHSSQKFVSYTPCSSSRKITIANGSVITVAGQGDIVINKNLTLKNVLHEQNTRRMIGHAKEINGLYYLEESSEEVSVLNSSPLSLISESIKTNKDQIWLYHLRLGHPSFRVLKIMFPSLFKGLTVENFHCDICELAKHKRTSFPVSNKRTSTPFSLVHSDVWGPSTISNISGARWFVSFIDDCTRVSWIFLLKQKSDVRSVFSIFYNMIKTQFGVEIKRFRSDNAKDYFNQFLSTYFQERGIIHESSCVTTPQQNGVAERKNGHILAITRTILFQKNVPKQYWGEAVLTATHLLNRLPTKVLESQSPMQVLAKFFPDLNTSSNLTPKVFGYVAFVHVHSQNREKFDPRAVKCVFLGYSSTQKGYKCYHPATKTFFVTAEVTFAEQENFFTRPYLQGETLFTEDKDKEFFLLDIPTPVQQPNTLIPALSTPIPTPVQQSNTHTQTLPATQPAQLETMTPIQPETEPSTPKSPRGIQDTTRPLLVYSRKKAPVQVQSSSSPIRPEVTAEPTLNSNTTDLDDFPIAIRKRTRACTKHPLHLFMSYKNLSHNHKAFLTSLNSISIPKTVFEALEDENWRNATKVEVEALEKNKTWDLVKLPEGKKPVGCRWVYIVKYKSDGSLERYKARLVAKRYTQMYGIDYLETFAPVAKMNTQFDIKNAFLHGDLEEEVYMDVPPGFGPNTGQAQKYIVDLLTETGKLGCKPAETPIEVNHRLGDVLEDTAVDRRSYQKLVGKLIYLSHTKPDIAYAVGVVSQFMHNPKKSHLSAVYQILQYLKGKPGKGILFKKGENLTLEASTDADYAGSMVDRRSTSGYCTFLGGNLVTWRSKKQNVVARSSAEAEFRAMALGVCELLWLKIILEDLKIKWEGPMKLYCDNKSAINIAHNPVQHDRTKHVEVDRHFIKEKLDSGLICTPFVSTDEQLADILTKGLSGKLFQKLVSKLRMDDIHFPA